MDLLLACGRRLGVVPDSGCASEAGVRWTRDIADPEFKKNLRIFRRLIAGAVGVCERGRSHTSHGGSADGNEELAARLGELTQLLTLPSEVPLTLELLLGQRFELERLLVEVGDEEYLRSRAADFYSEGEGTAVTWGRLVREGLFPGPPPLLADLSSGSASASADVERTRRMLAWLIAAKETEDLPLRARRELKQNALLLVVLPVLVAATALFGVAIGTVEKGEGEFLLAAAAGAAGAGLGGLLRLRDEVNLGAQIREFVPFFLGQVVVGAAAGLLAFVVVKAGIVRLGGGTSGLAAFGFVVGFSEAAFLGLVGRVGETLVGTGRQKSSFHNGASSPGCDGRCEARTQGAPISSRYGRD